MQYFDGRPNWQLADHELKEAIRLLDLGTEVGYQRISSFEEAEELQFRGSPRS